MSSRKLDNESNLKKAMELVEANDGPIVFPFPLPLSSDFRYNAIAGKVIPDVGYLFVTYRHVSRDDETSVEEILVEKEKSYRYVGADANTWGHDFYIKRRKTYSFLSKRKEDVASHENFASIETEIRESLSRSVVFYTQPVSTT